MDLLFGDDNKKEIREYERIISQILKHKRMLVSLSNDELKNKTSEFRERLKNGESLDDILPEAFAVAKEASRRFLGKEQRDVQLMGALALHRGDIAEMKTGEGKTLTAPIAAYLNALTGKSVHIATANDYLSTRDCEETKPLFEGLGLTSGVVTEERLDDINSDLEKRKKAYSCDITYGSSNAFAFDYLKDNTAKTKEQVVRGDKEVGFVIIDEADQILVNDAVMPFKLSGMIEDKAIEQLLSEKDQENIEKEKARLDSNANTFVNFLFDRYQREVKQYRKAKEEGIRQFGANSELYKEYEKKLKTMYPLSCGAFISEEEFMLHQGGDKNATKRVQGVYSVLFCKGVGASLTEKGWLEAFNYFRGSQLTRYINNNKEVITNNDLFKLDEDYSLDEYGITLSLQGLEKAVNNIPTIKSMNNEFYSSSEFTGLTASLDNALKAYFVLEKGKDYILQDTFELSGEVKKKVLLVSNGRVAEGRVYSGRLQQAIELKESRLDNNIKVAQTIEYDELASVSQKAFYSIYPKISGMTGTSSKELFENVYGMPTVNIPKHTEYNVDYSEIDRIYRGREDKETVLFANENDKLVAVVSSAIESQKKGQPVLIGTLSVNESNRLYQEFARRGIACEVLNAENAKEEAKIISRAGKRGAITISTQMAGRGTDIKLGGELNEVILEEKSKLANQMAELLDSNIPFEERIKTSLKFIESKKMDIITSSAINRIQHEREELIGVGGLKVIGYGHYPTRRDDDQLRGRAARQADPGVTEFYASIDDLKKNLGCSNERILDVLSIDLGVSRITLKKDLLGKKELSYFPKEGLQSKNLAELIDSLQRNKEAILSNMIASTQEVDRNLSVMRRKIYEQRTRMINGEETKENMEYIIDSSISNLIEKNLPQDSYSNHRKKIKSSGLNINNFIIDVEQTFGIDLTNELESNKFRTLGDIEHYLQEKTHEQYTVARLKNGDERQDKIDRNNIISTIDNAWREFNENLDLIKFQHELNNIVQNKDYDEIYAMKKGFNNIMAESKIQMLGKMFGKTSTKVREVQEDKVDLEIVNDINDYEVYNKKNYTNLSVRPAKIISTLSEKFKVIKNNIKYQFELVSLDSVNEFDSVQNIDFDGNQRNNVGDVSTRK